MYSSSQGVSLSPLPSISPSALSSTSRSSSSNVASGSFHKPRSWADRKSTRLNSSHSQISYAVFCLKKKIYNHPSSEAIPPPLEETAAVLEDTARQQEPPVLQK